MAKLRSYILVLSILSVVFIISSLCVGEEIEVPIVLQVTLEDVLKFVTIEPSEDVELCVNEEKKFTGKAFDIKDKPIKEGCYEVVWGVIGDIGSITADGVFTAEATGEGEVVASVLDKSASVKVRVLGARLFPEEATLDICEEQQFTIRCGDTAFSPSDVTWSIDNPDIGYLNEQTGSFLAFFPGTANICIDYEGQRDCSSVTVSGEVSMLARSGGMEIEHPPFQLVPTDSDGDCKPDPVCSEIELTITAVPDQEIYMPDDNITFIRGVNLGEPEGIKTETTWWVYDRETGALIAGPIERVSRITLPDALGTSQLDPGKYRVKVRADVKWLCTGEYIAAVENIKDFSVCPNIEITGFTIDPTWALGEGCNVENHKSTCQITVEPAGNYTLIYSIQGDAHGASIDSKTCTITPASDDSGEITVRASVIELPMCYSESTLLIRAHPTGIDNTDVHEEREYGAVFKHLLSSTGGSLEGVLVKEVTIVAQDDFQTGFQGAESWGPVFENDLWYDEVHTPFEWVIASDFLPSPPKPGLPATLDTPQVLKWKCPLDNIWIPFVNIDITATLSQDNGNLIFTTVDNGVSFIQPYIGPPVEE